MAGADRRESTGIERNTTARLSFQPQDDDDYDLEAMGISDGFRPSGLGQDSVTGPSRMSSQVSQSPHVFPGRRSPPPRPSSTAKPGLESFTLRNEGALGASVRRDSDTAATPVVQRRSSSASMEMAFVRVESPYQGPSGPSHPYQMYSQESRLARTASVATASTVQVPDRPYNGAGGPTSPYGMYPQNTVPEGGAAEETGPAAPVGFPGSNNRYQRRLGPDGEEIADIIGPDGHTEQLPPYTKYPDDALARKTQPNLVLPAGAGGIGLATRNPEFSSREDLTSPRESARSVNSDSSRSNHQINMAAATVSEKPQLKPWQKIAQRKVCSIIPIWVIVLTGAVFVIFGIILGTVLAILRPKHHPKNHPPFGPGPESVVTATMTTTFDATPLASPPTTLPALPTGIFALPINIPSTIQTSCILDTAMSAAWSCTVPWSSYTINVSSIPGSTNALANMQASLGLGNNTFSNYYAYGTQPPVLPSSQVLTLVTDSQDPQRGPAWFFELPYNKMVIVPEVLLSSTNSKRDYKEGSYSHGSNREREMNEKDNGDGPDVGDKGRPRHVANPGDFGSKRGVAEPGDHPWFCYWNETLLEAFIYVNLTSSAPPGPPQFFSDSASPTSTITSPPAQGAAPTNTYAASVPTSGLQDTPSSGPSQSVFFPPAYPKVLKLEERRIPYGQQSIAPYCIQQSIDANGIASPLLNSTGQPTTIYLDESEPSVVSQIQGRDTFTFEAKDDGRLVERQTGGSCGCVWLWT